MYKRGFICLCISIFISVCNSVLNFELDSFAHAAVPVRTSSDQPYRLQKFKLRLFYASDIRQPDLEVLLKMMCSLDDGTMAGAVEIRSFEFISFK